jgi:hypothetical protein
LKYIQLKKERGEGESHGNDADQVLVLLSRITAVATEDPPKEKFLKHLSVSAVDGGQPYAIAYKRCMMIGISGNCTTFSLNPSAIGIDKTFNACKAQVSLIIYQNKNLIREGSSKHPIFLGAVFVHWKSDSQTFASFLTTVKNQLQIKGQPILGSDDELALTKAIEEVFSDCIFLCCTRHLEGNASDHLEKKQKIVGKEKDAIIYALFHGTNSLTSSPSEYEFEKRQLEAATLHKAAFQPAYWDYLMVRIKERIVIPSIQTTAGAKGKWTNNQCESWNSLLKTDIDWKKLSIPDLLDHLERMGQYEENEVKAAIFGQGGLRLAPHMAKYQVTSAEWDKMTPAQKEARYHRVLKGPQLREAPGHVVSTNGTLEMTTTPTVSRKPGQITRGTPNRTYTQAKAEAKKAAAQAKKAAAQAKKTAKNTAPEFNSVALFTDAIDAIKSKQDEKKNHSTSDAVFSDVSDLSINIDLNNSNSKDTISPEKSVQNSVKRKHDEKTQHSTSHAIFSLSDLSDPELNNSNSEKDIITSPEKSVQNSSQDLDNEIVNYEDPFNDDYQDPDYYYPFVGETGDLEMKSGSNYECDKILTDEEHPSKRQRMRPRYLSDYDK